MSDNQGNPVDKDGKLIVEVISSTDELTDADFEVPSRSVQLPPLPKNVEEAIGANGRPVVIKKNIFEKNKKHHEELDATQGREILSKALYNPNLYGASQPIKRPDYRVVIRTGDKNSVVVLDVYDKKDNVK